MVQMRQVLPAKGRLAYTPERKWSERAHAYSPRFAYCSFTSAAVRGKSVSHWHGGSDQVSCCATHRRKERLPRPTSGCPSHPRQRPARRRGAGKGRTDRGRNTPVYVPALPSADGPRVCFEASKPLRNPAFMQDELSYRRSNADRLCTVLYQRHQWLIVVSAFRV